MNKIDAEAQEIAKPKPNTLIEGENHALKKGYNPFPSINLLLGRSNLTVDFKYNGENKPLYTIVSDLWDPVHEITKKRYADAGKRVLQTPEQKAEVIQMDQAKFPDKTYKYMISYTHFKRMYGNDGEEYLVRQGYFHGLTFLGKAWKYFKSDFDFHYEPEFEQVPALTGSSFDMNYGDIVRQTKVYHTRWDADVFNKAIKDIPFPDKPHIGVSFTVGIEGGQAVWGIPDLQTFKTKSFEDLLNYAQSNDTSYLDNSSEEKQKK